MPNTQLYSVVVPVTGRKYVFESLDLIEKCVKLTCCNLPENEQPCRITTNSGFVYVQSKSRKVICRVYTKSPEYELVTEIIHF